MKAILFARVSSREQEETGYSLPAQQKLLEEYAKKKGFQIQSRQEHLVDKLVEKLS